MLRSLLFLAALAAAATARPLAAAPRVLIDTDFGTARNEVKDVTADGLKSITGVVPEGWSDNTGWKKEVRIEYRVVEEAGRKFLRVTQTKGGGVQFTHALPGVEKEAGLYRLTLTARSPGGSGASLGIRFVGAPYTTCWSKRPDIGTAWGDFSLDFTLPKQPQGVGLYLWIDEGSLDLHRLRLVKLSREDLVAEMRARYPAPPSKNRVRVSRFPLGLQSGWFLDRDCSDGDEVTVASDKAVTGPSGAPSLRIIAEKGMKVTTAPFLVPPWSAEPHTVSLAVRGKAAGKLVAIGDGRTLAEKPLAVDSGEWQRVALTFTPVPFGKAHTLRIEATGTLWIDALQVEERREATPYAPPMPFEVSLALPASDASPALIQFDDEQPIVLCCATGEAPGAVLKAKVVNVYGDEKALPDVPLGKGFLHQGKLRYALFAERPYGTHRVEAWVEDGQGRRLSPESEIVVHRLRRPRYWGKDAPDSPFGVHTNSTTRHNLMAKAVGCNWVRLHDAGTPYIGWAHLEPEKGQWQFRDTELRRYRKHGLKILGLLSTAPGWATDWGQPATGYFERYFQPKRMEDWANAVRTIVKHHEGVIDTYEVWNEPWGSSFWIGSYDRVSTDKPFMQRLVRSKSAEADFALLQKTAYEAAKATLPALRILGFNTMPGKWTADLLTLGAMETCDRVSYHDYSTGILGVPGDACAKRYDEAIGPILKAHGTLPKPTWMSEGTVLECPLENGFYHWTLPYDEATAVRRSADDLARYVLSHRVLGDEKAFLYTMHGHGAFGVRHPWTSLVAGDGSLHPQGAAHSALAWLLEDTRYVKSLEPAEGVHAHLFAGKERAVAALASRPTHKPYNIPAGAGLAALDLFGNPLRAGSPLGSELAYLTARSVAALEKALR